MTIWAGLEMTRKAKMTTLLLKFETLTLNRVAAMLSDFVLHFFKHNTESFGSNWHSMRL